jgi:aspartyl-tRNA(Asn)/glutamyl-tRNA(Gln) amidotransferase subunit C
MSGRSLVKHLSWLARIEVSGEEEADVLRDIEALRKLIERILEAPVKDVPPLHHPLDIEGVLRDDEPEEGLSREEALMNAASEERGFVKAPRTVED